MAYDAKKIYYRFDDHLSRLVLDYEASRQISPESESLYHGLPTAPYDEDLFVEHNVKRGLRNADGSGVVAGLTRISDVHGYNKVDGKVVPDQGKLTLRGYSIEDLVNNAQAENRYGYEEVAYLLITGSLPNKEELDGFCERLGAFRHLSDEYVKEFPMTTVSSSIMNVLQRAVRVLRDSLVDVFVAAGALVDAALLGDDLAGTLRVELVRCLGVQPGNGAAKTQTFRRDDAAVRRGEGLTEDAGEEAVNGFVGHGGQTVVTHVVARHGDIVQEGRGLDRIGDEVDLALVDDSVEFIRDHMVQDFREMRQPQALVIGVLGDPDPELVALAGVHDAFHVVEPGVDLPLDDGFKVGLHLLARDIDAGGKRVLEIAGVDIRAVDDELMVLDLVHVLHEHELAGGILGGPEFDLHVGLADDLALECGRERDGDRQLLGLDLDAAQLERLLDGLCVVGTGFQRARDLIFAEVDVDHDREAQRDRAGTGGNHRNDHVDGGHPRHRHGRTLRR